MLRRLALALIGVIVATFALAQTPSENILRMNAGIHPTYYCNYTNGSFCGGESYSGPSLRTITDATGAITSAPNELLLNNATLSTQDVTVSPAWNYMLSFYGTGSVTLSGSATGALSGTGANNQVYLKINAPTAGTLTLTVSGSVTSAMLSALTYESAPRASDFRLVTSAAYYGPAFDYDPVSYAGLGLRVEESRTNLFLNSGSPATQTITVASGSAYSISFYGTGVLTLSGALTKVMTGGAYPTRTTYTGTTSTTSLVVTVTTLGTMSYPQVELGGFATSATPTAASSVTRAADMVSLQGAARATAQGTRASIIVATSGILGGTNPTVIGSPSSWLMYNGNSSTQTYNGSSSLRAGFGILILSGSVRNGVSFAPSERLVANSLGNYNQDANSVGSLSGLTLGYSGLGATYLNGRITNIAIYARDLTPPQLQARTRLGAPF